MLVAYPGTGMQNAADLIKRHPQLGLTKIMVSEAGVVYQADLGPDTLTIAGAIDTFDPGPDWTPVDD